MRNMLKNILIFTVIIHIVSYINAQVKETVGEDTSDIVITQRVKEAFATDPAVNKGDINVETYEGVVQLSGFVDTSEQVSRAGEIAAGVKGVKSVKNTLIVKEEGLGEFIDDSIIIAKIKTSFALDPTVSALSIKVNSLNGAVQLSGFVDSAEEARRAEEIAAGVKGVKLVENDIIVK
ncbi:MAG: BON domain-containing protein [wastewater metagenome]|nr:BON domain-containing protein [Candidatus Loosdrechtia aerotolerans]